MNIHNQINGPFYIGLKIWNILHRDVQYLDTIMTFEIKEDLEEIYKSVMIHSQYWYGVWYLMWYSLPLLLEKVFIEPRLVNKDEEEFLIFTDVLTDPRRNWKI